MTNEIQVKENRLEAMIKAPAIRERFNEVLGKKASVFMSSVISAYKTNKNLGECEPMSVISAALQAASLDLPINQSLGMAHIVPYSKVGQFQIGWKGLVQLAQRTGLYETMNASLIHEGQLVSEDEFTGEFVFKKERISDKVIGYLFYFKLLNGYRKQIYWPKEKVEAHAKRYSKSFSHENGRWKLDFDAMALKTVVIEGLKKWGPMSIEMQTVQKAISTDQAVIDIKGEVVEYPDAPEEQKDEPKTQSEGLKQAVKAATEPSKEDGILMDYRSAINEATTPERVDELYKEAAEKLSTDNKTVLYGHAKMRKKAITNKD